MGFSFRLTSSDFGTSMPTKSQEEPISSMQRTSHA
jgi:hypothetical protein